MIRMKCQALFAQKRKKFVVCCHPDSGIGPLTLFTKIYMVLDQLGAHALISAHLTLCMLGNFSCFRCRLLTFSKFTFSKNSLRNTIRVSNRLDPDQDPHFFGPDLSPNCLQKFWA